MHEYIYVFQLVILSLKIKGTHWYHYLFHIYIYIYFSDTFSSFPISTDIYYMICMCMYIPIGDIVM